MTAQRWQRTKDLLDQALDLAGEERREFLDELRANDPEVASQVERLLAVESEAADFIETPAFDIHQQDDPSVRVGQPLGPYRLVKEVGAGGMGTVYLAARADEEYDKTVAVKVLKRGLDTEEIVHRFRNERQILAGLVHPNIARLLDGGTTPDGRPYLVMDHVQGRPIDVYCHEEGLDAGERLALFRTVCDAVQFAHRNLVVHRDLKPSNILVSDDGVPKLLDFGIARLLTPERGYTLPTAGVWRFLTPEYASPEQLTGAPVTTATDVYSLGVLLYALLTDRRPYDLEERSAAALARVLEHAEPPKPSSVAPQDRVRTLRGDLDNIVLTALRREPERRYGSVEALADDLRRHAEGLPVRATPDSVGYRVGKFVRRHRAGVAAAVAFVLLLMAFGVVTTVLLDREMAAREVAEETSGFLIDMFESVDPTEGRDRTQLLARTVLDEGRDDVLGEEGKALDPKVRAQLLYTLARTYFALGLDDDAEALWAESTRLRREIFGPGSEEMVNNLALGARIAREHGEGDKVEPMLREAIRIQTRHHGGDDHVVWTLKHNLASALGHKGRTEEAEQINRDVLRWRRRSPEPDPAKLASTLHNLANNVKDQGRRKEAEELFREALQIRRTSTGISKEQLANTLNGLGSVVERLGRWEEAEAHYREALALYLEHYEQPGSKVASAMANLARLLAKQEKFAEAEDLYVQSLDILEKGHPNRGRILSLVAVLLLERGRHEEAEDTAREAVQTLEDKEIRPWWVADARSILGTAIARQGRHAEAEPLLLDAYPVIAEGTVEGSEYAAAARQRIVDLYDAWGRPAEAARWRDAEPGALGF